jgi:hypothetical protein
MTFTTGQNETGASLIFKRPETSQVNLVADQRVECDK